MSVTDVVTILSAMFFMWSGAQVIWTGADGVWSYGEDKDIVQHNESLIFTCATTWPSRVGAGFSSQLPIGGERNDSR